MTRFDRYDQSWWRYFFAIMTKVRRENRRSVVQLRMNHTLASLGNSGLTADSYKRLSQGAKEQVYDLLGTIMPWEGVSFVDFKKTELNEARQAYIDAFNVDPLDPGFKQWEAEQIAKLDRGDFEPAPSADEVARTIIEERMRLRMVAGK